MGALRYGRAVILVSLPLLGPPAIPPTPPSPVPTATYDSVDSSSRDEGTVPVNSLPLKSNTLHRKWTPTGSGWTNKQTVVRAKLAHLNLTNERAGNRSADQLEATYDNPVSAERASGRVPLKELLASSSSLVASAVVNRRGVVNNKAHTAAGETG